MLVDQLPKEFNRWLGSVLLHCRHIDIVDEDEALCISLSSVYLLSLLDQLCLNVCLSTVAVSPSREIENDWKQMSTFSVLVDEVLNDHRLSSACASSYEERLAHGG